MFKLKRFYPTELEIEISPQQLVQMFPIEIQEHPTMGIIERVWKTGKNVYSVESLEDKFVIDMSQNQNKLHKRIKPEKMLEILQNLDRFEIILYYQNNEDKYIVTSSSI